MLFFDGLWSVNSILGCVGELGVYFGYKEILGKIMGSVWNIRFGVVVGRVFYIVAFRVFVAGVGGKDI